MLTIGLDLRPTEAGFKAHAGRGTGRYADELLRHLALKADEPSTNFALQPIYSKDLLRSSWEQQIGSWLPCGRRTVESQILYPRRLTRIKADAIHFFSHGDAPARSTMPCIVTVLDLIPLKFPQLYRADKTNLRFRFARFLEYQAIRNAAGILAISQCTKNDLVSILGVEAHKIAVTPLAVSSAFTSVLNSSQEEERRKIRQQFQIPLERPMMLYVGGIDPRKNVPFLIDILKELYTVLDPSEQPLLCLAGAYDKDDQLPRLKQKISQAGLENQVRLLGFVPDNSLPALYRSANLTLFPSLYEGFGFPVLESMACGVPVISGNNSSIPEVVGQNAKLCADNDLSQWTGAVLEVLGQPTYAAELRRSGIEKAATFSWETTAAQTIAAYQRFIPTNKADRTCPSEEALNSPTKPLAVHE